MVEIEYLRSLPSIRTSCSTILELGKKNELEHFKVHMDRIPNAILAIENAMTVHYPAGIDTVPFHSRWRHFEPDIPRVDKVCSLFLLD